MEQDRNRLRMKGFWFEAWWLESLRNDLERLVGFVISKREDFKRDLIRKLEEMMEKERDDENLAELIDTKI
ncbi:hypothetical protein EPI10_024720 [Gossypium australe]|uniref:Uncharacterized protein n=1 Tax=Gossypium australe TaxID=47621 RepID=A0A5B6VZU6_9ROSI|nr:hypothetical protein EPI10_024720 [Gossypium australe]